MEESMIIESCWFSTFYDAKECIYRYPGTASMIDMCALFRHYGISNFVNCILNIVYLTSSTGIIFSTL